MGDSIYARRHNRVQRKGTTPWQYVQRCHHFSIFVLPYYLLVFFFVCQQGSLTFTSFRVKVRDTSAQSMSCLTNAHACHLYQCVQCALVHAPCKYEGDSIVQYNTSAEQRILGFCTTRKESVTHSLGADIFHVPCRRTGHLLIGVWAKISSKQNTLPTRPASIAQRYDFLFPVFFLSFRAPTHTLPLVYFLMVLNLKRVPFLEIP